MTRRGEAADGSVPLAPGEHAALFLHPEPGAEYGDGLLRLLSGQLPDPSTLAPGSWVALGAGPAASRRLFGLIAGRRRAGVPLAVRCTALLARGYTDIQADDSGVAFGRVPR
jgi:hypothetical protein